MQIWAETGKSALPIHNYSQILYQFLTFTQNLKRSPRIAFLQLYSPPSVSFPTMTATTGLSLLLFRISFNRFVTLFSASVNRLSISPVTSSLDLSERSSYCNLFSAVSTSDTTCVYTMSTTSCAFAFGFLIASQQP